MAQNKGPRLEGRNGEVWRRYLSGWTQERIAAEHGITQSRVSRIIAEVRESIPEEDRQAVATTVIERLDRVVAEATAILERDHPVVHQGRIVHDIVEYVRDEDGNISIGEDGNPLAAKVARLVDDSPKLQALDRILKADDARRRLLGLDAPRQTELSGTVTTTTVEPELLARLRERNARLVDPGDPGGTGD
ncbi:hypothetical protein GCM10027160_23320 [Streptomyces calidiresistens]|uniref:sigma factor-like helix-turn-helix DNA-binding protein n=1 Tax=Streptomyces calidiresistens TaxID=1485586 RepID=UPI0015F96136|nr:sigma factor-like helix-turn-helix DNA-binding protein [Streptomyces calidiresistens]